MPFVIFLAATVVICFFACFTTVWPRKVITTKTNRTFVYSSSSTVRTQHYNHFFTSKNYFNIKFFIHSSYTTPPAAYSTIAQQVPQYISKYYFIILEVEVLKYTTYQLLLQQYHYSTYYCTRTTTVRTPVLQEPPVLLQSSTTKYYRLSRPLAPTTVAMHSSSKKLARYYHHVLLLLRRQYSMQQPCIIVLKNNNHHACYRACQQTCFPHVLMIRDESVYEKKKPTIDGVHHRW